MWYLVVHVIGDFCHRLLQRSGLQAYGIDPSSSRSRLNRSSDLHGSNARSSPPSELVEYEISRPLEIKRVNSTTST